MPPWSWIAFGGHLTIGVAGGRLRGGGGDRGVVGTFGERPCGVGGRGFRALDGDHHVGARVLHRLKPADRLTELPADLDVLDRHLEHAFGAAAMSAASATRASSRTCRERRSPRRPRAHDRRARGRRRDRARRVLRVASTLGCGRDLGGSSARHDQRTGSPSSARRTAHTTRSATWASGTKSLRARERQAAATRDERPRSRPRRSQRALAFEQRERREPAALADRR